MVPNITVDPVGSMARMLAAHGSGSVSDTARRHVRVNLVFVMPVVRVVAATCPAECVRIV